ncbi:redox-regulated ATPase YchF, partial [bacterium]|nr:redox-regulated ATPase YchF [bacterium]
PDSRLQRIAGIVRPKNVVPAQLEFVDIAGLVRGASRGEGLGNRFLAHIREVDAIVHVLRCFADDNVAHVEGSVDPLRDADTVETELMAADLESLERREEPLTKKVRGGDAGARAELDLVQRVLEVLRAGRPARAADAAAEEGRAFAMLQLLSAKPVLYVCNVEEADAAGGTDLTARVAARAAEENAESVAISAQIEAEVAQLDDAAEKAEFLESLGLGETGLARLIVAGYRLLDLITFFSATGKEARAWTVHDGTRAAAAVKADMALGVQVGVSGTPSIFLPPYKLSFPEGLSYLDYFLDLLAAGE